MRSRQDFFCHAFFKKNKTKKRERSGKKKTSQPFQEKKKAYSEIHFTQNQ